MLINSNKQVTEKSAENNRNNTGGLTFNFKFGGTIECICKTFEMREKIKVESS